MIPKPYSTHVTAIQAVVVGLGVVCLTILTALDKFSGDTLGVIIAGVVGTVLGTTGTVAGANGVASKIAQASEQAIGGTRVTDQRDYTGN